MNNIATIILLFGFGLIFGSFVNALVWRLHEQLDEDGEPKKLSKKQSADLSITKGRSMCPGCKHTLAAKDLVPVFSWLWLRGKCRYCKVPISVQYPMVELITALLFSLSYIFWPDTLTSNWHLAAFISWLAVVVGLVALAVYDIKWMLLPDRILYPLIGIALISVVLQLALGRPIFDVVMILLTTAITSGIFWVIFQISSGKWIGGGDVKLGILTGIVIGFPMGGFLYLFIASILGLLWAIPQLITRKATTDKHIAFGPFLIASAYIVVLFGQKIIDWYFSLFRL